MSKDKDAGKGQGKGPSDPAAGQKKPSAIIDLKATEITGGTRPAADAGSAARTSPAGVAVPPTGIAAQSSTAGSTSTKGAAPSAPSAVPASGAARTGPAPNASATGEPKTPIAKPTSPEPRRSGFVTLLTHATAGVLGGLIALLAADTVGQRIGQQLGLPMSESAQQGKAVQERLGLIEAELKKFANLPGSPDPSLASKLQAAERRLAELEKAGADLAALKQAQTKLAADAQALQDRVAKGGATDASGAPVDASARLAKLEEQLGLLATAAGTDPQRGRIPQLAAVSGKVADLEIALASGLASVRKGVTQEMDARLTALAEAAETAKSGVVRIDRDVGQLKGDTTRATQRLDGLKSTADRLETGLDGLKTEFQAQLKGVARTGDVKTAVEPVAAKVAALETTVQTVVKSEEDRRQTAERVVLSLELGNLKRALDRGSPYAAELAVVQRVAGGRIDLASLEASKTKGLPTQAELLREFRPLAHAIIEADRTPADGGVVDRLLAGAKSIVRVRKTEAAGADDKSVESVVARMEVALKSGQMQLVTSEAATLSKQAAAPARDWLDKVAARAQVETAMAKVDEQLKSVLGAKAKGAE